MIDTEQIHRDFRKIEKIITKLEEYHENSELTSSILEKMQQELDKLAQIYQYDAHVGKEKSYLYELQALILLANGEKASAENCMLQAAEISGNPPSFISDTGKKWYQNYVQYPSENYEANEYISNNMTTTYIPFLHRSQLTTFLLSFFTLSLYDIVWAYKNWKAIKVANNQNISPSWRALFLVIWSWALFEEIIEYYKSKGYEYKLLSAGTLTFLYLIPLIGSNALSRVPDEQYTTAIWLSVLGLTLISAFIVSTVQMIINEADDNNWDKQVKENSWTTGEVIIIIVGFILFSGGLGIFL